MFSTAEIGLRVSFCRFVRLKTIASLLNVAVIGSISSTLLASSLVVGKESNWLCSCTAKAYFPAPFFPGGEGGVRKVTKPCSRWDSHKQPST